METYEAGREASLLADMKAGTKTIECRLDRGKFHDYRPGDRAWIREDTYEGNEIVSSRARRLLVEVTKIERFSTFREMFEAVGYQKVVPRAKSLGEALRQPSQFYSPEEEKEFGTLAIHFRVIES